MKDSEFRPVRASGAREVVKSTVALIGRSWWVVAICLLLGGIAGAGISFAKDPVYQSTATLYLTTPSESSAVAAAYQGSLASQQRAASYVKLVRSDAVLARAIRDSGISMDIDELRNETHAVATVNTVLLSVSVRDRNPVRAAVLANAISSSMIDYVAQLEKPDDGGAPLAKLTLVTPAVASGDPASIGLRDLLLLGLAAGGLLGVILVLARARLSTKLRDTADVEGATDRPVLGTIPSDSHLSDGQLLDFEGSGSGAAESFRKLRTNLSFVGVDGKARTILISSPSQNEGKSTTCANLAKALAESGLSVVLVDADLRRPSIARMFGVSGDVGLTDVLRGAADVLSVVQSTSHCSLDIVAAGTLPPNPSEILDSVRLRDSLSELRDRYDYVVVDSPPVNPVADAVVASQFVDGCLLVVRSGRTTASDLNRTLRDLDIVGRHVFGVIVNGAEFGRSNYYAYGESRGLTR